MSRMTYLTPEDADEEQKLMLERLARERMLPTPHIFRALAHVPEMLDPYLDFGNAVRHKSGLPIRTSELLILVVGYTTECEYELSHHLPIALRLGLTREEYDGVKDFESSPFFDANEKALMRFARELTRDARVSQANWDAVRAQYSEKEMMALILTISWYCAVVRIMGAIDIDLEH